jgi:hypothetical protein
MKESTFSGLLASKLRKEIGGKIIKISDKVMLGLPDNMHIKHSFVTFYETKIGTGADETCCFPWEAINDIRQYEVCKRISRYALVLYVIYYPDIKMTAVLSTTQLSTFRVDKDKDSIPLFKGPYFSKGHGVESIRHLMERSRSEHENIIFEL